MTQKTTARGTTTALAALGVMVMALGSASACASSTTAGGKPSGQVSTTPMVTPVPSVQPGGPVMTNPSATFPAGGSSSAAPPGRTPGPANLKANGYSTAGTTLTVYFFGGVCQKFGLKADQSTQGQVRVTVIVTQWPKPGQLCPALIRQQAVSTDLGSPLNGRSVVDTVSGKVLPLENPLPSGARVTHGPIKSG
ncbi:hypothetical protein ABIA33_001681 [Streptacidiphilus sp. MAP12-16]|uniref:hypothetical protein n=1 Tax=Streptacidiphilus sp. MAP12-16 TaxID=3156300 RepID=UPI003517A80B